MGFDSGRISLRVFELPVEWSPEILAQFARHAAPALTALDKEPIEGWVSGRHLLDRTIGEDNCLIASGYIHLHWMKAERKVPEALLRAHCRMDEEVELRARNLSSLPRKVRAEIRAEAEARLLPDMPPTLTGIPMVIDLRNRRLLAGSVSDKATDTLLQAIQRSTGCMPVMITPEKAAMQMRQINVNDLEPRAFTTNESVETDDWLLGDDFLTWLWFVWEKEGGTFHVNGENQPFGFMLEGPLMFVHNAEGAHEAVLRKGSPLLSAEAGTALWAGKKLRRAKFVLAQEKRAWETTLDAASFSFSGLKLPETDNKSDPTGRFHERMLAFELFHKAFMTLFDRFLVKRGDSAWQDECRDLQAWVTQRARIQQP